MTFPNDSRSPNNPIDPLDRRPTPEAGDHLQADPALREGRAGASKMGLIALAVLAVIGIAVYGMNAGGPDTASTGATTTPPAWTATTQRPMTPGSTPTTGTPAGENTGAAPVSPTR